MKKIIISGGTGLIGSRLSELLSKDYKLFILTRSPESKKPKNNINYLNIDNDSDIFSAIDGAFAIINLAGAGIGDRRWTKGYKQEIVDSRVSITRKLIDLANKSENKPKAFFSASAVGYYGNRGDEVLKENSSSGSGFLAEVCKKWEEATSEIDNSIKLSIGRIGVVLSEKGGALDKMKIPYKFFVGGPIGNGKQYLPWIHIDDLVKAIKQMIESYDAGVYNLSSPEPIRMNKFSEILASSMNRPNFFRVPEFILKFILGESAEMVLNSQRVIPEELLKNSFSFEYSNLKKALKIINN